MCPVVWVLLCVAHNPREVVANPESESFCAISIGLQYWTGILENAEEENLSEAKNLKPKLLSFLQESYRSNKISSETESKIRQLISETSKKHDLD